MYVLVQVLPPSVDLKMWLVSLWGKPPPPSSMPATYTSPVARSPVICTLRMKGWRIGQSAAALVQVRPLSVE